jgi:23S rRNA (guanosine2251-2'-O)-methyltransferase
MEMLLVLENIRSAHNVGAIFRTAEGAGVVKIYLVGHTPCPIDRFGRPQPEIIKTSLGASSLVPWEHVPSTAVLLEHLTALGTTIIAVEQTPTAVPYTLPHKVERAALIFGNEIDGVSHDALAAAHHTILIPMSGSKESLNVATTAGIICFTVRDQWARA